jgi:hypothetical protein
MISSSYSKRCGTALLLDSMACNPWHGERRVRTPLQAFARLQSSCRWPPHLQGPPRVELPCSWALPLARFLGHLQVVVKVKAHQACRSTAQRHKGAPLGSVAATGE